MEIGNKIVFGDLVSVICSSYNNFQYFNDCVISIKKQNYPAIEVIFTDDFSEQSEYDDFVHRVNSILSHTNNITYKLLRSPANLGTVINESNGIKEAKGKVIIPLAFDDFFYNENTISDIVTFFSCNDVQFATAKRLNFKENNPFKIEVFSESPSGLEKKLLLKDNDTIIDFLLNRYNFIGGCNTYFTKDIFLKYDYNYRYRLLEDLPFYYELLISGEKLFFIDLPTIYYRTEENKKVSKGVAADMKLFYSDLSKDLRLSKKQRRCLRFSRELYIFKNINKKNFLKLFLYPDAILHIIKLKRKIG